MAFFYLTIFIYMRRIIIKESQYKLLSEHIIKESSKEVLLGAGVIICRAIGKNMTKFNKFVADKAVANKHTMAKIKDSFEDENKLKSLADEFTSHGFNDLENVLSSNAKKIIDEFNETAKRNNLPYHLNYNAINTLKSLAPKKD